MFIFTTTVVLLLILHILAFCCLWSFLIYHSLHLSQIGGYPRNTCILMQRVYIWIGQYTVFEINCRHLLSLFKYTHIIILLDHQSAPAGPPLSDSVGSWGICWGRLPIAQWDIQFGCPMDTSVASAPAGPPLSDLGGFLEVNVLDSCSLFLSEQLDEGILSLLWFLFCILDFILHQLFGTFFILLGCRMLIWGGLLNLKPLHLKTFLCST